MSIDMSIRIACQFGKGKGYESAVNGIQSLQKPKEWQDHKFRDAKRGKLIELFEQQGVWEEFKSGYWSNANSKQGKKFIDQYRGAARDLQELSGSLGKQPEGGRVAVIDRETKETSVRVEWNIDGSGNFQVVTGLGMFDHFLAQLAQHGVFDLKVAATGADPHHLVEDVAICLGRAFNQALGEKQGIVRMSQAIVPMDEALVLVAVDIGGRGYAVVEAPFSGENIGDLPADLIRHFLESLAAEARLNLHARVMEGINDHHKAEALFKALARALDVATRIDPRRQGKVPSTKEVIER